ncbi:DUF2752 domain-containing protein [Marinifilum sp. RC60d5]|uniref:DUF2752 domain-containing protein n=1 Tax=Marinifilum sp. RC60d5 TaxID=3458414 RepID=UPI0040356F48
MKLRSNNPNISYNYRIINLTLAGVLCAIFLYSALFSPIKVNHPIPSVFTQLTGAQSPSSGLSRSFSSLIRCNFELANRFNPIGLQIFLFFLIQLIFRTLSFLLIKNHFSLIKLYIFLDIIISIIAFLLAFKPLILFTLKLFRNFIVN